MMVYIRNTVYIYKNLEKIKKLQNLVLIRGVSRAGLEGFWGTLGNRRRVSRVGRRVDSARSERMRATSGKSLYVAPTFVTSWATRSCQRLRGSPVRVGDSATGGCSNAFVIFGSFGDHFEMT